MGLGRRRLAERLLPWQDPVSASLLTRERAGTHRTRRPRLRAKVILFARKNDRVCQHNASRASLEVQLQSLAPAELLCLHRTSWRAVGAGLTVRTRRHLRARRAWPLALRKKS